MEPFDDTDVLAVIRPCWLTANPIKVVLPRLDINSPLLVTSPPV